MKQVTAAQIGTALHALGGELTAIKTTAEELKGKVDQTSPEDVNPFFGKEGDDNEGAEVGIPTAGDEESKEGPKKGKDVSTPEKAKKVLDEAKNDLQAVIDGLDGLVGETAQEEKRASVVRINPSYQKTMESLANRAEEAIIDAQSAVQHWGSILPKQLRSKNTSSASSQTQSSSHDVIATTEQTLNGIQRILKSAKELFGTGVPPTGAEFSGDKNLSKDVVKVEQSAWNAGAAKMHSDVKKENTMPNAATEPRLDNQGYNRNDKPHVAAILKNVKNNKYASFWDIYDSKTGKRVIASFSNVPDEIGARNEEGYKRFASKAYGETICSHVISRGIENVRANLNGQYLLKTASLDVIAAAPDIENVGKVRKYYAEAYGDAQYAREMTSSQQNQRTAGEKDMNVKYVPKDKVFRKTDGPTKDGPGKLSSQEEKAVITARAERAVVVARKAAALGVIPFVKTAVMGKCRELMTLAASNDKAFLAVEASYDEMLKAGLAVDASILTQAHIPDTEQGVVGNNADGVSNPKSQVASEDINNNVKSDAKIAKKASIVPQMQTESGSQITDFSHMFTTTASKLQNKGVDITSLRTAQRRTVS